MKSAFGPENRNNMEHKTIPDRTLKETTDAGRIAKFFGFLPIIPPIVEKQDLDSSKDFIRSFHPAEKSALMRMYFEEKMMAQPQPNLFYCERPFKGTGEKKKTSKLEASLVTLGSFKSVCECLTLEAGIAILKSLGYKNLEVEINSVGDKESVNEFHKKLSGFVRKNYNTFSAELRQASKKDLCAIFRDINEFERFTAECPKSIDFLSEQSRLHFKEMLEFLETTEIPYSINHCLVGDIEMGSETIFVIKNGETRLAYGFRFNRLAKKIGCKKELPATMLTISAKLKKKLKTIKLKPTRPQFYLVQFGPEAKLKSYLVLEELYKNNATVCHAIAKDKLGSQMSTAENSEAQYILLMGQKEALENSIIIRNTLNRAQEIVPLSEFEEKIKKLLQ
jgi:histidyl-tRNA synthetase